MARVALLCPDLLFGSRLRSALEKAGHEVLPAEAEADVLVVDLTDDADARVAAAAGAAVPVLGFYAHVEQDVRKAAEAAGFSPRGAPLADGPGGTRAGGGAARLRTPAREGRPAARREGAPGSQTERRTGPSPSVLLG